MNEVKLFSNIYREVNNQIEVGLPEHSKFWEVEKISSVDSSSYNGRLVSSSYFHTSKKLTGRSKPINSLFKLNEKCHGVEE